MSNDCPRNLILLINSLQFLSLLFWWPRTQHLERQGGMDRSWEGPEKEAQRMADILPI